MGHPFVQVQLLTPGELPGCGSEVTITIATNTPLLEVKRQLQLATGVPMQHQKVVLSAINQIVMGDKRSVIKILIKVQILIVHMLIMMKMRS